MVRFRRLASVRRPTAISANLNDMGADVVATQRARCGDPVMTVIDVIIATPSPYLDGRERLTPAHRDRRAGQPGAGLRVRY